MKHCTRCNQTKSIVEFGKNKAKKDGLQTHCKICRNESVRAWYADNKEVQLARVKAGAERSLRRLREFVLDYLLSHPCVDCGEPDPVVLQFDHVTGQKTANIARMIHNKVSIETLKAEITKCEVRCANCHTRRTAQTYNWFKGRFESDTNFHAEWTGDSSSLAS